MLASQSRHTAPNRIARVFLALTLNALLSGCSLSNISIDECASDDECVLGFGLGSSCSAGFCTPASTCDTGFDCREIHKGGACVAGTCRDLLPLNEACPTEFMEPADLPTRRLVGDATQSPMTIIGTLCSLEETSDEAISKSVRLAVREITDRGGVNTGTELGVVVCDNGGPDNSTVDEERRQLNRNAIDYLSGSLGVPGFVGAITSTDSLTSINYILERQYPTVMISPSATSPALTDQLDRLDDDDPYGLFWRTSPSDKLQGKVLADSVVGQYPADSPTILKVAVIFIDDAYGEGLAQVFKDSFDLANDDDPALSKVAELFPFDDETNLESIAADVEDYGPDALLMIAIKASQTVGFIEAMAANSLADKYLYLTDGSKDAFELFNRAISTDAKEILRNQTYGTAPATPSGSQFDFFDAALRKEFDISGTDFAFLAQAYDATYALGYSLVYATSNSTYVDGKSLAEGLSRLVEGVPVEIGANSWPDAKQKLATGDKQIDIDGVSGPLDFDPVTGEAPAPIEVWKPNEQLDEFVVETTIEPI